MANETALKVAVLVGSLRAASHNRKLAQALKAMAAPKLAFEELGIGELPLYNEELDQNPPRAWVALRDAIRASDAVLFVTPEYNRSVPGALKNAIDIGSRPYGSSAWSGKPAAVISGSPGAIGGFGANHHLRQSLVFLDMPVLQQPEAYIGGIDKLFDAQGGFAKEDTTKLMRKFLDAFERWIRANAPA